MSLTHQFGGEWTEEKLNRLRQYLDAYMKIFSANPRAAKLKTIYVDAFAGTGYRSLPQKADKDLPLFEDEDAVSFQRGSAYIALETEPSFDQYIFIEHSPDFSKEPELLLK